MEKRTALAQRLPFPSTPTVVKRPWKRVQKLLSKAFSRNSRKKAWKRTFVFRKAVNWNNKITACISRKSAGFAVATAATSSAKLKGAVLDNQTKFPLTNCLQIWILDSISLLLKRYSHSFKYRPKCSLGMLLDHRPYNRKKGRKVERLLFKFKRPSK